MIEFQTFAIHCKVSRVYTVCTSGIFSAWQQNRIQLPHLVGGWGYRMVQVAPWASWRSAWSTCGLFSTVLSGLSAVLPGQAQASCKKIVWHCRCHTLATLNFHPDHILCFWTRWHAGSVSIKAVAWVNKPFWFTPRIEYLDMWHVFGASLLRFGVSILVLATFIAPWLSSRES